MGVGVYIPNETKPSDCYICFCYETEFNMCSLSGKRIDNVRIRLDDCPLIEIDLVRCGECKYWHEGKWYNTCDKHIGHGFEDDYFCKDGERNSKNNSNAI